MRLAFPSLLLLIPALVCGATTSCDRLSGHAADGSDGAAPGPGASGSGGAAIPSANGGGPSATPLALLGDFEGEIDGFTKDSTKPGAQPVSLTALVKAGKARVNIPEGTTSGMAGSPFGGSGYAIFDSTSKHLTAVSDAKQQAVVIDLNTSGRAFSGMGGGRFGQPSAPSAPTKITKTGKMDTVAGYRCEYWDIATDHKTGTVCMGSDGPSWFTIPLSGLPASSAWMSEVLDGKHFPLRFVGYGKDGATEQTRLEVTKLERKPVPDTTFQVPPGYRVIDLSQMMSGLGGIPGMPSGIPGMPPGMPGMPPGMPAMPPGMPPIPQRPH